MPPSRPAPRVRIPALLTTAALLFAHVPAGAEPATYAVRLLSAVPPRLAVTAELPLEGQDLAMATTRPADIPELDAGGWPALVTDLQVTDPAGDPLAVSPAGTAGWRLEEPASGRVRVEYVVDYSALAARGWPAPREAAFADSAHLSVVGRSLFLTTERTDSCIVEFDLPAGWHAATPWRPEGGNQLGAGSPADLVENLVALSRRPPEEVRAGGFRLLVVPMGHWHAARAEVHRTLDGAVRQLVKLMGAKERAAYLVVLLPVAERGGESFRASFAMTVERAPSAADRADWGNTIAHEVFHRWNGWRLRGADYAASQWFQEGFTEYAANLSLAAAELVTEDEFRKKLSTHLANSRRLTAAPEASGTRKGPPLYGAGALIAFTWDVLIRDATEGRRGLGFFLRALWRETDGGRRPYGWPEIRAALMRTAPRDWDPYYEAHIQGNEPLPLRDILPRAGLRLVATEDGAARLEFDPGASRQARALWKDLLAAR